MLRDGNKIIQILIITTIMFISFYPNQCIPYSNNIIFVDNNGNGDFELIQDAIDKAIPGDKIFIYNGFYHEDIIINKSITLTGENKTYTKIIGSNNVIQISSDNVKIEDLTISNGLNGIIILYSSNSIIIGNNIKDNYIGINSDNQSINNLIYNNNFINNTYNAHDNGNNKWYNTGNREGNYWDDYDDASEGAYDNNGDGIVDNPYNLSKGLNKDLYPKINAISIVPCCNFSFSPLEIYTFEKVKFNDTSYDLDGYIVNWFWDFGDGKISILQNTTNEYANEGIYNVTLEITDNYGIVNKCVKKLIVFNSKPIVNFYYSPIQPDDVNNVIFYDESYDKDGGIVKWEWDFGDGTKLINPDNPREISHKYEDNGTYNVTLKVFDNDDSTNSTTIKIRVLNVKPSANFYYKLVNNTNLIVIKNDEVKFVDTSKDKDGEIIKHHWDFGDNSISNISNPVHLYEKSGTYDVTLTVYDNDNESDSKQVRITVLAKYEPTNNISFPTGMSLILIILISLIVFFVIIAIKLGKKV
jgi:PKD repeat protein